MNKSKIPMWKRFLVLTVIFAMMCQNVMPVMAAYEIPEVDLVTSDELGEVSAEKEVGLTKTQLDEAADEVVPEGAVEEVPEEVIKEEPEVTVEEAMEVVPEVMEEEQVDDTAPAEPETPDTAQEEFVDGVVLEEADTYSVDGLKAIQTIESGPMAQYLLEGEKGFSVTDGDGNAFDDNNPVKIDSYVNITYRFKFPNNSDIKAGTELYLYLPKMIEISEQMRQKQDFESEDGIKATWFVDTTGMITVTFEEDVELSNVTGMIKISSKVDSLEFSEETLDFDVGIWDGTASFPTDYDEEEPRKVTIKKTNSGFDPDTRTITWNITVTPVVSYNPASKSLAGITVVDTFTTPEQSLTGDVYLNDTSNVIAAIKTATGFTYTFPDDIGEGAQTLIFQTKLDEELFSVDPDKSADNTIKVTNTADALLNDEKVASSSAANTVSVSRTKITKNCSSIDVDNNLVEWTIVINQEKITRKNATVIDYYPEGTEVYLNPGTNKPEVTITGESGISDQASITDDKDNNKLTIALGDISKQLTIVVTLKITDLSKLTEVVSQGSISYEMTNTAVLMYDNEQYAKIESTESGIAPGINGDLIKIKKEGEILNYETEDKIFLDNTVVEWNITIQNILVNKAKTLVFEDTLPSGHIYQEDSFQVNGNPAEPVINGSTISYTLSDADKSEDDCVISFKVKLNLSETVNGKISNVGYIKFDDKSISDTGEVYLNEKLMLSKDSSFNPAKSLGDGTAVPTFSWKVDFNNATPAMNLTDVIVTDTLPDDHVLVEDSIKLYSVGSSKTEESLSEYFDWSYKTVGGKTNIVFTSKAGKVIDKHFRLEFDTVMKEGVAPITATNEVTLESAQTSLLSASATEPVDYETPVEKSNTYKEGQVIEWTVDINKAEKGKDQTNYLYPGSYLQDQLVPALDLIQEEGSVVLYELQRKSTNSDYQVTGVKYENGEYTYDAGKLFTYYLPKELDADKAYRLVFKTKIVNAGNSEIKNTCTFKNVASETKSDVSKVILKNVGGVAVLEGDNLIVQLMKTGISKETGEEVPLKDVSFEIFKKDDDGKETVLETGVTTENGIIRFTKKLLFAHTYYVRETSKPDGYVDATGDVYAIDISDGTSTDEKIQVTITKNDDPDTAITQDVALDLDSNYFIIPFSIKNELVPDEIEISKVAVIGSEELPGAKLTVYEKKDDGSKGKQVDQWVSDSKPHKISGDKLAVGEVYILEETSAPDGYAYAKDITFRIEQTGSVTVIDNDQEKNADGKIVMVDELIPDVNIRKTDITGEKEVNGATLTVYEKNEDGTKGKKVDQWVSDGVKAHIISGKLLKTGQEYILEETIAPNGYRYTSDITFTIADDGTTKIGQLTIDEAIVMKDAVMGDIGFTKRDITGDEEVTGAVLTLYEMNSGNKGAVVESWTSDGTVYYIAADKLKAGQKYVLEETKAAPGYMYAADIVFELNDDGELIIDKEYLDDLGNVVMKDEPVVVSFKKTDAAGEEVPGATLTIYKKNEDGSKGEVVTSWISTTESHEVKALLDINAEYILEETNAPNGYSYATDITFSIDESGKATVTDGPDKDADGNIVMIDELTKMSISKINAMGNPLAGAVLSIYEADTEGNRTETIASDKEGEPLRWESTEKVYDITGISPGIYVLHEEEAPWGYYVAYDITFTVNNDGSITKVSDNGDVDGNKIIMTDLRYSDVMPEWISLVIEKTVTGTAGDKNKEFTFTLTLQDEDGTELEESFPYEGSKSGTIKSGQSVKLKHGESIQIYEIPLGVNYEVAESGNEGYEVTAEGDIGIISDTGEVASFVNHKDKKGSTVTPTPTPTPTPKVTGVVYPSSKGGSSTVSRTTSTRAVKTGDTTAVWMWIIICLVCAGAVTGVVIVKRNKVKIKSFRG